MSCFTVRWSQYVHAGCCGRYGARCAGRQAHARNPHASHICRKLTGCGGWHGTDQVIFLILFVAYFVIGVVSLAVDAEAMDAPCAEDSWIWLYVLLVIVIPTSIGFVIGLVQSGLQMIEALKDVKYDIFLALPSPLLMVVLGILGIVIWGGMSDECDAFYSENHGLLLGVFRLQVHSFLSSFRFS